MSEWRGVGFLVTYVVTSVLFGCIAFKAGEVTPNGSLVYYFPSGGTEIVIVNEPYRSISLIDSNGDGRVDTRRRKQIGPISPACMVILDEKPSLNDQRLFTSEILSLQARNT